MRVRDAIIDLWELAGEPSDLDPWAIDTVNYDPDVDLDAASTGVGFYLRQLSLAQVALANWRTRKGRPIRFKKFQVQTNIPLGRNVSDYNYEITFMTSNTLRITTPDSTLNETNLANTKMILNWGNSIDPAQVFTEEVYATMAVYNTAGNFYLIHFRDELEVDSTLTWDSSSVDIYWDRFSIGRSANPIPRGNSLELPNKFRNLIKLLDMNTGSVLKKAGSKESLFNPYMTSGTPGEWYDLGDTLYLDKFLDETIWYTIEYQKLPDNLVDMDSILDIPEEWHEVLLLIVEWRVMKRMQDKQRANELAGEISRWIDLLRTDLEEEWLRDHTSGFYIRKEAR